MFPKVYQTKGVVRFVTFEGQPASIPQKQIDNLRLLINSDAEVEVSSDKFEQGDNVEVIRGALTGLKGELIKIGVERGRKTKPNLKVGICGEHGGDADSVKFCHSIGMNYVSCSPFRVPIARLAAAQAAIEDKKYVKTT